MLMPTSWTTQIAFLVANLCVRLMAGVRVYGHWRPGGPGQHWPLVTSGGAVMTSGDGP